MAIHPPFFHALVAWCCRNWNTIASLSGREPSSFSKSPIRSRGTWIHRGTGRDSQICLRAGDAFGASRLEALSQNRLRAPGVAGIRRSRFLPRETVCRRTPSGNNLFQLSGAEAFDPVSLDSPVVSKPRSFGPSLGQKRTKGVEFGGPGSRPSGSISPPAPLWTPRPP